jgi:hypothetical protein
MYKKDFLAVGGHDDLFAPQSKEDSDLFNRFILAGYKVIQSWDALVYHFTSRGSRLISMQGEQQVKIQKNGSTLQIKTCEILFVSGGILSNMIL